MWYGTSRNFLPVIQSLCLVMTGAQLFNTLGFGDALKDQIQHGHEVALAAPEAAVEVAGLTAVALNRTLNKAQGVIEAIFQFRGDHIVFEGRLGPGHPLGQFEDKVPFLETLGNLDQIFNKSHRT
jgi:hypothetical protein